MKLGLILEKRKMMIQNKKFTGFVDTYCKILGKNNPGFVYILKSKNLYKIGRSKNLKKRIQNISISSPYKVELVDSKFVNDCHLFESVLHKMFKNYRVVGEWFKLDEETLQIALTQYKNG